MTGRAPLTGHVPTNVRDRVRAGRSALVGLLLVLVTVTGCVQVPTGGPIKKVAGTTDACQSCVNVEVDPPVAGSTPKQIVDGYLRATTNYQPNYKVARQFLTSGSAESWQPEAGAVIYTGSTQVVGDTVRLEGVQTGALGADRTFTAADKPLAVGFRLVQENGEWRIDKPPDGLFVAEFSFRQFYIGYSVFFFANGTSLVPERIYLPTLRNQASVASALMTALLEGAPAWLSSAVSSAIPVGTSLSAGSVTITNGVAELGLSANLIGLDDPARSQLAAQVVYTLRQVSGIKGVRITTDTQQFRVPEGDPASSVIPVDAFSREIDPVPYVPDVMFALAGGGVQQVSDPNETPTLSPIDGPLGVTKRTERTKLDPSSLAVSVNGTDVAVATRDRTALHRSPVTGATEATQLATGLREVLRPQFSRYGEVWAIGRQNGRQRLWRFAGKDEPTNAVDAPVLRGAGEITAFRISPDGVRMALVRQVGGRSELGLARIVRGETVTVDGWRPIRLAPPDGRPYTRISDVAWLDANELLVMAADSEDGPLVPVRTFADSFSITPEAGVADWDASQLSVLTRPQTVVVVGREEQAWRDDTSQWREFVDGVDAIAYPG